MRRIIIAGIIMLASSPLFATAPLQGTIKNPAGAAVPGESSRSAATDARLALLTSADRYVGVPYRYGGTDSRGMDCSGLVITSFKDALGAAVPRTAASLYSWTEKIDDKSMQMGDLVFFKTAGGTTVSHVGIYAGDGRFIHSASDGPKTGVMYSRLDEDYWRSHYAGAGRALPEGTGFPEAFYPGGEELAAASGPSAPVPDASAGDMSAKAAAKPADKPKRWGTGDMWKSDTGSSNGRMILGVAAAPSWNGFLEDGYPMRGVATQLRFAFETHALPRPALFGIEMRPEWDGALGVFRMPITLSAGLDDRFRIFIGPSVGAGDAALKTENGTRRYSGGMSWIGAAGISAAPFSWEPGDRSSIAPYAEFAWQNYIYEGSAGGNWNADICAGLRFSTGIKYSFTVRK